MSDSVQPHRQPPTRLLCPWDSPSKNTGVGWHFLLQCMKVKSESEVTQSCPTLSDLMDCSLPGSSVHGIFQARVLEWGAIALSEVSLLQHNWLNHQSLVIALHLSPLLPTYLKVGLKVPVLIWSSLVFLVRNPLSWSYLGVLLWLTSLT